MNLVNMRKEFFHVELSEIETFAKQRGLAMAFTKIAEAREYRESTAMRLARGSGPTAVPARPEDRLAMAAALAQHATPAAREHHASAATPARHAAKPG